MYVAGPNPREQFSGGCPSKDCPHWCTTEANVALTASGTNRLILIDVVSLDPGYSARSIYPSPKIGVIIVRNRALVLVTQ